MSALFRFARLGARNIGLARLVTKDIQCGRRLCHSKTKEQLLKEIEIYEGCLKHNPEPWESYGYDYNCQVTDRLFMNCVYFGVVTLILVVGGTVWMYQPDGRLKHWAQREAFLQLRYREEHGLPLIDPNLIDPAKIVLPSDEELGDTDIII